MKIKTVKYAALANLGNYENERIELEAELEKGDDYQKVLADLTDKVHSLLNNKDKYYEYVNEYQRMKRKCKETYEELEKMKSLYEKASAFLAAQGLKRDMPLFPIEDTALIAPAVEEVEAEYDESEF